MYVQYMYTGLTKKQKKKKKTEKQPWLVLFATTYVE